MKEQIIIQEAEFTPKIKKYIFAYVALILLISFIGIPLLLVWVLGLGQSISKKYYENLKCQLTEGHLEYNKGVLFKVEKTIPLENIQDLTFIQNPILNYFGLKILQIETAGGGAKQGADMKLVGIVDSSEFKKKVLQQREILRNPVSSPTGSVDSPNELLAEIRDLLIEIKEK